MSNKIKKGIMKTVFVLLFLLCITNIVFAEAVPPIPLPKIPMNSAIELAKNYFHEKWRDIFKKANINIEDYIITSVQWTNHFNEYHKEWAWKIIFVHPIQNDHTATYRITDEGEIIEEGMTK